MGVFRHQVSVSRFTNGTGGRRVYASVGGEHFCFIEPIDTALAQVSGYALEKTFVVYFQDSGVDVKVGDKITEDSSSEVYSVKGIKRYTKANGVEHAEAIVEVV